MGVNITNDDNVNEEASLDNLVLDSLLIDRQEHEGIEHNLTDTARSWNSEIRNFFADWKGYVSTGLSTLTAAYPFLLDDTSLSRKISTLFLSCIFLPFTYKFFDYVQQMWKNKKYVTKELAAGALFTATQTSLPDLAIREDILETTANLGFYSQAFLSYTLMASVIASLSILYMKRRLGLLKTPNEMVTGVREEFIEDYDLVEDSLAKIRFKRRGEFKDRKKRMSEYNVFDDIVPFTGWRIFTSAGLHQYVKLKEGREKDKSLVDVLQIVNRYASGEEFMDYARRVMALNPNNHSIALLLSKVLQERGYAPNNEFGKHAAWLFVSRRDFNPEDYERHPLSSTHMIRLREEENPFSGKYIAVKIKPYKDALQDIRESLEMQRCMPERMRVQKYMALVRDRSKANNNINNGLNDNGATKNDLDLGYIVIEKEEGTLLVDVGQQRHYETIAEFLLEVHKRDYAEGRFDGIYDISMSRKKLMERLRMNSLYRNPAEDMINSTSLFEYGCDGLLAFVEGMPLARTIDPHGLNFIVNNCNEEDEGDEESRDYEIVKIDDEYRPPKTLAHDIANFVVMQPNINNIHLFDAGLEAMGYDVQRMHRAVHAIMPVRAISLSALYPQYKGIMLGNAFSSLEQLKAMSGNEFYDVKKALEILMRE